MKTKDEAKDNILKGVNKKLKRRNLIIAAASLGVCLVAGGIVYFSLFVKQIPLAASDFTNVFVNRSAQTINEITSEELPYNQLKMQIANLSELSIYAERKYYLEKNADGETASIYFYMSQTRMQRSEAKKQSEESSRFLAEYAATQGEDYAKEVANISVVGMEEGINSIGLVSPQVFHTDLEGALRNITKVYYLVYDFDNFNQDNFERSKKDAILLWQE